MLNLNEDTITQAVLARHAGMPNERLRQIMTSLVQHLHAFAREVQLTEEEWFEGVRFLTETGQLCSDKRQEFILLSDTLGLSTLVMADRRPSAERMIINLSSFFRASLVGDPSEDVRLAEEIRSELQAQP